MHTKKEVKSLTQFLQHTGGNWRNAVYVACCNCICPDENCSGYLLTADTNGAPFLFPIKLFCEMTGEGIEKEDCVGILSRKAFESVYAGWLLWNADSPNGCGISLMFDTQQDKYNR